MALTPLPTPPSRDDPANFATRGDAFLGALPGMVDEMNGALEYVAGSVQAAQNAAAAASASVGTTGTSTTSLTIGTGAKTLTIETGKVFVAGQWVVITHSANGANQMVARIDGYNSATGVMAVTVSRATGSGTAASWIVGLTPAPDDTALPKTGGAMTGAITDMGEGSTVKDPGGTSRKIGYRNLPRRAATSQQTLALDDVGKMIAITTGGIVIPANASVAFDLGDTVTIYNDSGSSQSITAAGGVTLRLAGNALTGSRTIAQRSLCTLIKVNTNEWIAAGMGVS
ncbi:hypothetical protein GG804_14190 [Sphingomonas histidinilytica]|uniref:hypothetical protein n=1 Tax=Rhizorhabdus histidinilytica TaxID=439228 RepID=UPI001AD95A8A|nr:hypothetical protein [Rhizorhabdus histidinilytica]MBO9377920.1 hypothetical protein [Rhizorhabdus histidinilytica]